MQILTQMQIRLLANTNISSGETNTLKMQESLLPYKAELSLNQNVVNFQKNINKNKNFISIWIGVISFLLTFVAFILILMGLIKVKFDIATLYNYFSTGIIVTIVFLVFSISCGADLFFFILPEYNSYITKTKTSSGTNIRESVSYPLKIQDIIYFGILSLSIAGIIAFAIKYSLETSEYFAKNPYISKKRIDQMKRKATRADSYGEEEDKAFFLFFYSLLVIFFSRILIHILEIISFNSILTGVLVFNAMNIQDSNTSEYFSKANIPAEKMKINSSFHRNISPMFSYIDKNFYNWLNPKLSLFNYTQTINTTSPYTFSKNWIGGTDEEIAQALNMIKNVSVKITTENMTITSELKKGDNYIGSTPSFGTGVTTLETGGANILFNKSNLLFLAFAKEKILGESVPLTEQSLESPNTSLADQSFFSEKLKRERGLWFSPFQDTTYRLAILTNVKDGMLYHSALVYDPAGDFCAVVFPNNSVIILSNQRFIIVDQNWNSYTTLSLPKNQIGTPISNTEYKKEGTIDAIVTDIADKTKTIFELKKGSCISLRGGKIVFTQNNKSIFKFQKYNDKLFQFISYIDNPMNSEYYLPILYKESVSKIDISKEIMIENPIIIPVGDSAKTIVETNSFLPPDIGNSVASNAMSDY